MATESPDFQLTPPSPKSPSRPKEPLHSMLLECAPEALLFTHSKLMDYKKESQLDERFPEVGLTRREYLEQVHIALVMRNMV